MNKDYYPLGHRPQEDDAAHPKDPTRGKSYRQIVNEELNVVQTRLDETLHLLRMQDVEHALLEAENSRLKVDNAALAEMCCELQTKVDILTKALCHLSPKYYFTTIRHSYYTPAEVKQLTDALTHYRDEVKVLEARIDEQEQVNANLRYTLGDAYAWVGSHLCDVLSKSIMQLMDERDEMGNPIVRYSRQWWAIYRVLVDDHGLPEGYTDFCALMDGMGLGKESGITHPCTVESLKKVDKPFDRAITDWEALANGTKPHQRQYRVAVTLRRIIKAHLAA